MTKRGETIIPRGITTLISEMLPKEEADLYDRRPDRVVNWRDPNTIQNHIASMPYKGAAALAQAIWELRGGYDGLFATMKKAFPETPDLSIKSVLKHDFEYHIKEKYHDRVGGDLPAFWTLHPEKPKAQQMRISAMHFGIPTIDLVTDPQRKIVPLLSPFERETAQRPTSLVLDLGMVISYTFKVHNYIFITEKKAAFEGTIVTAMVAMVTAPSEKQPYRFDMRFYAKSVRIFDEVSSKLLEINELQRQKDLEMAHLLRARNMAQAISTPMGGKTK